MQALQLTSDKCEHRLYVLQIRERLLACIHEAMHGQYGNTEVLHYMVCDRKRIPGFENQLIFKLKSFNFCPFMFPASYACCQASLYNAPFYNLNLYTQMLDTFKSPTSTSKLPMKTPGIHVKLALAIEHLCG